jgi:glutaredoxin
MSSVPPRRCAEHNLVLAPDGTCVLCRREASAVVVPVYEEPTSSGPVWIIGGVVALAVLGYGAWSFARAHRPEPPPTAAAVIAPPKVEPTEAKKPPEDDLTKSLRMLQQAEVERLALESARERRESEQKAAGMALREREEKERDAKRHESVKRELDTLGLAAARRSVSITMYSTSWCGVCKQARGYMQQQQISYTEIDIDHDAAARARQQTLNPRGSVPTIAIDDQVLIGFSPESLEDRITRAAKRRRGS